MTVKELIEELKKHEPEMNVRARTYDQKTPNIYDDTVNGLVIKHSAAAGETYVAIFSNVFDSIKARS